MIMLGIVLIVLGYWFLPEFVPQFPFELDHLAYGIGILLVIIGVLLFIFGHVSGRAIGGRRYWY
jgi:hypothetical protein